MEITTKWILQQLNEPLPYGHHITTNILREKLKIPNNSADNDWLSLCQKVYRLYQEQLIDFDDEDKGRISEYVNGGEQFLFVNVIIHAKLRLTNKGENYLDSIAAQEKRNEISAHTADTVKAVKKFDSRNLIIGILLVIIAILTLIIIYLQYVSH